MWLAIVPLFVMGLWWPQVLWDHFIGIARSLGDGRSDGHGAMNGARSKCRHRAEPRGRGTRAPRRGRAHAIRLCLVTQQDDEVELRYLAAVPNQREFDMWTLKAAHDVPSLARIWPALGWYEREIMDLYGSPLHGSSRTLSTGAPPWGLYAMSMATTRGAPAIAR